MLSINPCSKNCQFQKRWTSAVSRTSPKIQLPTHLNMERGPNSSNSNHFHNKMIFCEHRMYIRQKPSWNVTRPVHKDNQTHDVPTKAFAYRDIIYSALCEGYYSKVQRPGSPKHIISQTFKCTTNFRDSPKQEPTLVLVQAALPKL